MRLRFGRHVRESLAAQLISLSWWCLGGSGFGVVFFHAEIWVALTSLFGWFVLQGAAHSILALDDDDNGQSQ